MEMMNSLKKFWNNEKKYLLHLRYALLYLILYLLALNTPFFEMGFVPQDMGNVFMIAVLLFYRTITYAIVPAILAFWVLGKIRKELK